jgi:hypothetical protein
LLKLASKSTCRTMQALFQVLFLLDFHAYFSTQACTISPLSLNSPVTSVNFCTFSFDEFSICFLDPPKICFHDFFLQNKFKFQLPSKKFHFEQLYVFIKSQHHSDVFVCNLYLSNVAVGNASNLLISNISVFL